MDATDPHHSQPEFRNLHSKPADPKDKVTHSNVDFGSALAIGVIITFILSVVMGIFSYVTKIILTFTVSSTIILVTGNWSYGTKSKWSRKDSCKWSLDKDLARIGTGKE
jgi:hypothetical protein